MFAAAAAHLSRIKLLMPLKGRNRVACACVFVTGLVYEPCLGFAPGFRHGLATHETTLVKRHRHVRGRDMFDRERASCRHHSTSVRNLGCTSSSNPCRMSAGPAELWQSYLGALDAAPLLTKSITAGVIFPAADAVAQYFGDKDDEATTSASGGWDVARTLRWLFFGFAVQAPWNHFFYVLLDGALPPTPDPLTATTAIKVFIDQFVQAPIFTVIIFGVLGLLEGKSTSVIRQQLNEDYKSTMIANWGVFVPAAVVNLAFCPPELRVLFLNIVFFGWTIFLSTVVSGGSGGEPARET